MAQSPSVMKYKKETESSKNPAEGRTGRGAVSNKTEPSEKKASGRGYIKADKKPEAKSPDYSKTSPAKNSSHKGDTNVKQTAKKSSGSKATSPFGKAFAEARKSGAKEFTFGGKKYNTKQKGE